MSEFDKTPQEPAAPEQTPPPVYQDQAQQQYQAPPQQAQQQYQYQTPPPYGQPQYAAEKPLHVPSLILGIIAIVTVWFTVGFSGLVCGIIGIILAKNAKLQYKSTSGFVLSLIGLIIGVIYLILFIIGMIFLGAAGIGLGTLMSMM